MGELLTILEEHERVREYWEHRSTRWATRPVRARLSWRFWQGLEEGPMPPLLDAGCGVGEFLELCVKEGFSDVFGVDLAAAAVSAARQRLRALPDVEQRILVGDLASLCEVMPGRKFGTVVCDGALNYTTYEGAVLMLRNLCSALKPGGRLCLVVRSRDEKCNEDSDTSLEERGTYRSKSPEGSVRCTFSERDLHEMIPSSAILEGISRHAYQTRTRGRTRRSWYLVLRRPDP